MKEFINKLIDRLEELTHDNPMVTSNYILRKDAIEIVNQLAEEYKDLAICNLKSPCYYKRNDIVNPINDGWIPCSKRLPEENGKYLVCVSNPTRNSKNCIFTFWYNEYDKEFEKEHDLDYVLAWQPIPAPYQPKGE